ncbi:MULTISPECIES: hypothetical protein [Moorena]|uniref:Uncharacterized protein n=1 Tax=Moorena producens 3L TaxID=489825 RepID=F4XZV4_9CYAN|nr:MULTISPECIES: hypothetical protein [Moorena]NEQ15228.1 hypothetical protein [Moorena sp. SIO3E2]EGJ29872.1 hypothetical protein LYNGBM3L_59640 [Moorena producens 3L]NEP37241.1 hypothetical protein [Moorena sp. SIO3B2]NEP66776.1 hypothetical protein [Moorena sp. SIO3A5]NEQ10404.1 hypothetical protein [Moorena sp. SIO4E2]
MTNRIGQAKQIVAAFILGMLLLFTEGCAVEGDFSGSLIPGDSSRPLIPVSSLHLENGKYEYVDRGFNPPVSSIDFFSNSSITITSEDGCADQLYTINATLGGMPLIPQGLTTIQCGIPKVLGQDLSIPLNTGKVALSIGKPGLRITVQSNKGKDEDIKIIEQSHYILH